MKKTKLISLLLILALLLCSMTSAAMAEEAEPTFESTVPTEVQQVIDENGYLGVSETNHQDLNSITYKVDEDSEVLYIYNAPVKYADETGEVQFKSNRAKKTDKKSAKNAEYAYENVSNDIKTYLPNRINDGILIEKDGYKVETFPTTDRNSKVKLVERDGVQYLEYDKAMGKHAHLSYTYSFDGFKENIILDKYMGQNEFSFRINTYGLVPEQETGIFINLLDPETGKTIFSFSQPFVMDARFAEEQRPSLTSFDNYYTIVKDPEAGEEESIYILTEVIDEAFLTDENTQYPVIIDPVTRWNYETSDVTVFQNTTSKATWDWMYVGHMNTTACPNYGNSIAMVQIPIENYLYLNPDKIVKAEYVAKIYSASSASQTFTYRLAIPNSTWTEDTATYSIANNSTTVATYTLTSDTWYRNFHNLTFYFKDWIRAAVKETATYSAARGFVLKSANPSTDTDYCKIYSNEYVGSEGPAMKVQYDVDNTLADGYYFIRNLNSGKYAESQNGSTAEGTRVWQNDFIKGNRQLWKISKYENLGYVIQPANNTNMYLSLAEPTGDTDGNQVVISKNPFNWYIVRNRDGTYRIISGSSGGKGLDVYKSGTTNQTYIQIWTNGGNANQKWIIENRKAIVIIPGILGSSLETTDGTQVWLNFFNYEKMRLNENGTSVYNIRSANYDNYGVRDTYKNLYNSLHNAFGSEFDVIFFDYDFRMSNTESAAKLETELAEYNEVVLVAHSMGGLVAGKYLTNSAANRNKTLSLISVGTPYAGAAKCIDVMETGMMFTFPILETDTSETGVVAFADTIRDVSKNSYAAYQLLPTSRYYSTTGAHPLTVNGTSYTNITVPLQNTEWGKMSNGTVKPMFSAATSFHSSLFVNGTHFTNLSDVSVHTIAATGEDTIARVNLDSNYQVNTLTLYNTGDDTVLQGSAGFGTPDYLYTGTTHTGMVSDARVLSRIKTLITSDTGVSATSATNTSASVATATVQNNSAVEIDPNKIELNERGWIIGLDNKRINIYADCESTLMVDGITVTEEGNRVYNQNGVKIGSVWTLGSTGRKMYALYNGEYEMSGTGLVKIEYMNNGYYEKTVEYNSDDTTMTLNISDYSTKEISGRIDSVSTGKASELLPTHVHTQSDLFALNID